MEKKIVILEHNWQDARLLKDSLATLGYAVSVAATSNEGIRVIGSESPDLVLVNLLMPDAQGVELINRIRSCRDGSDIIIVVISQFSGDSSRLTKQLGANDQISKPINLVEALRVVERHIGKPEKAGGAEASKKAKSGATSTEEESEEGIPQKGILKRTGFHQLLARIFRFQGSGTLEVEDEMDKITISFNAGCPTHIEAGGFIRRLVRNGLITDREAQAVRRRSSDPGRDLEALVELKILDTGQLELELHEFAYTTLRDLCRPSNARFRWMAGEGKKGKLLDPSQIIMMAVQRYFPPEKINAALESKDRLLKPMYLGADPARLPDLAKQPAIIAVIEAAQRNHSLKELFQSAKLPKEDLSHAAFTLGLLKVITFTVEDRWTPARRLTPIDQPAAGPAPPKPAAAPPPAPPRAEPSLKPIIEDAPRKSKPEIVVPPAEPTAPKPKPAPDKTVEITPSTPMTDEQLLRMGQKLLADKTYSKAKKCFVELIERQSESPKLLWHLADATFHNRFEDQLDRLFDAVNALRRALELDPKFHDARLELAHIFLETGHIELAKNEIQEILNLEPTHQEAQRELRSLTRRELKST